MTHSVHSEPMVLLSISAVPAEARAQRRVVRDIFELLGLQHKRGLEPDRDFFEVVANTPLVRSFVESELAELPVDTGFETFTSLKARKNAQGIVPLED